MHEKILSRICQKKVRNKTKHWRGRLKAEKNRFSDIKTHETQASDLLLTKITSEFRLVINFQL